MMGSRDWAKYWANTDCNLRHYLANCRRPFSGTN